MASDPFGEIPLFRELQKLLSSGQGPVNLELAQQIARAALAEGGTETGDPRWQAGFADSVRTAELILGGYTRLSSPEPARVEVLSRAEWATQTLSAWGWLFAKLGDRFASALEGLGGEAQEGAPSGMLGQVVPLIMGMQAGTLTGALAREVIGRYDLPVPREDSGKLSVVGANADAVASDYGFAPDAFRSWLALRDSARHLVHTTSSWVEPYLRSALVDIVETVELDLADMERRLTELQAKGPEALEGMKPEDALPLVPTEEHARALARLQAFVAVAEGYATHSASAVAEELVADAARIQEGMLRHERAASEGRSALAAMLGVSLDPSIQMPGVTFCNAVVRLKGIDALNQLWTAPDNLPTLDEVRDPFAWMERVLG